MAISPVIELTAVSKFANNGPSQLTILKDINLTIQPSETVAIVGPSGSGKTTLLSLMSGLDLPSEGDVRLLGQPISAMDEDGRAALRRDNIGIVFQTFQLLPHLSAQDNVQLPLDLAGVPQSDKVAKHWLAKVDLQARADQMPKHLSGGEQQRVAIARAFAITPKVLFADEPTGNLDTHSGEQITELLFRLNREEGAALIIVTHDKELASQCAQQCTLIAGELQ